MQRFEPPQGGIMVGQTAMDAQDFIPPRVKVCQQMSQEVADAKAVAGDFFNTLTGENYGTTLRFVPMFTFKQRVMLLRENRRDEVDAKLVEAGLAKMPEGDGLKCRSLDMYEGRGYPGMECNQCPLSKWDEGASRPPLCSETYNVAALTELGDVIFLGFQKSSAKTGRRVFSMLRMSSHRQKPHDNIFVATTRQMRNDLGNFFVPDVAMTGDAAPPELVAEAISWEAEFSGRVVDVTPPIEEDPAEGPAGPAPDSDDLPF